jgi:hypothetical protein
LIQPFSHPQNALRHEVIPSSSLSLILACPEFLALMSGGVRAGAQPVHFSGNEQPSPEIHSFRALRRPHGPERNPATKLNNSLSNLRENTTNIINSCCTYNLELA